MQLHTRSGHYNKGGNEWGEHGPDSGVRGHAMIDGSAGVDGEERSSLYTCDSGGI